MADDEKKEGEEGEEPEAPKSKKNLLMGGGIAGLIAAAYIVSMIALPGKAVIPPFDGPFVTPLTTSEIQVNLKGEQGKRYLVMSLQAKYEGYDELYVAGRVLDPIFQAVLLDALIGLGRQKTREDITDELGEESFMAQIFEKVDPILFPVHVGNPITAVKGDEESGVGPGLSAEKSTMRGGFKAHVLHVDRLKGTIAFDEGPLTDIDGTETDLMVANHNGLNVYVDISKTADDFVGDVQVGTFGHILQVLKGKFITQ